MRDGEKEVGEMERLKARRTHLLRIGCRLRGDDGSIHEVGHFGIQRARLQSQ